MILVDTDVVIDLLRNVPQAAQWFSELGDEETIVNHGYSASPLEN